MASTLDFVEYVCDQISGAGKITYKKMFGEYMIYVNDKPVLLVCDNTVFVKKLDCIAQQMQGASCGFPYEGAKEHYLVDIEDTDLSRNLAITLETVIPIPKPKKKSR